MENNMGDIMNCEDRLKSSLHCDDKEKLRRKLALLQREYLKTARRLQRAERLDAVRRHVRSRIEQQNHQDQKVQELTSNPALNPSSLSLRTTSVSDGGVNQGKWITEGPADPDCYKKKQMIRFQLPSDALCPQTPDPSHDEARGHRPTSATRLRSRRSRLRWEKRSAEAGRMTDTSEEGQEQSERMETSRIVGEDESVKSEETEIANESEEPFSASESESQSLLLTHWNIHVNTDTGCVEEQEIQECQEQIEKESLPQCLNLHLRDREKDCALEGERRETQGEEVGDKTAGESETRLFGKTSNSNTEQNEAECNEKRNCDKKEEMSGMDREEKSVGLVDPCTIVEGLLYPAEYYVRTTRRMTMSQSQRELQDVIFPQLSTERHRRGRGRGRASNRVTQTNEHSETNFHPITAPSNPSKPSHLQIGDDRDSQSSSEISDSVSDRQTKTAVCTSRSARGRRRKSGRGRGRRQTPSSFLSIDTNHLAPQQALDDPHPRSIPLSPSVSVDSADTPTSSLTSQEVVPAQNDRGPSSTHSTAAECSPREKGAQPNTTSGHSEKVYPIFLRSKSTTKWRSLLLPASAGDPTPLSPLPFRSPGSLLNGLTNFDIHQDFHLPDEQFASLKLRKLRQVSLESGVESFTSPRYNTRNSKRQCDAGCSGISEPVTPLPLPLSPTPTITESAAIMENKQAETPCVRFSNSANEPLAEGSTQQGATEKPGERQTENHSAMTHTSSVECVSLVGDCVDDFVDLDKRDETLNLNGRNCSNGVSPSHLHPLPHLNIGDRPESKVNHSASEASAEELSYNRSAAEVCDGAEEPGESVVTHVNVTSLATDSNKPSEATASPVRDSTAETPNQETGLTCHSVHSQLLQSLLASAPCPFITPPPPSSALLSSPTLPSLGVTPHPAFPLTSSPSAPSLTLPPPHSPSIQVLSPPALSPCPSLASLPSSLPPASPSTPSSSADDRRSQVEPLQCLTASSFQQQLSDGPVDPRIEETANDHRFRGTYTLKAPAGGCLVDACCVTGHSEGSFLAAAGKWAVCLWSRRPTFNWSLIHTWTFDEPVINVLPVPDATGLMCVTLGQLEIREVRMLSCSSLSHVLLCKGLIQAVVCAYNSKVVISSLPATGSTLEVFNVSDSSSTQSSQLLVSPGVSVGALAPVDGLSDALIGTDDCGSLFIWNLKTGQLLQRVSVGNDLCSTSCLRGYSYCGVLFVLLQHQLLISLDGEETEVKTKDQMFPEEANKAERSTTALFSLVAVNPLSGKTAVATKLYPPKAWSGRLCEADTHGSSVVGLSQNGCVCVWELGHQMSPRMVWPPESEGWTLARWGGRDVLVTGHHSGDVTLHCYTRNSV